MSQIIYTTDIATHDELPSYNVHPSQFDGDDNGEYDPNYDEYNEDYGQDHQHSHDCEDGDDNADIDNEYDPVDMEDYEQKKDVLYQCANTILMIISNKLVNHLYLSGKLTESDRIHIDRSCVFNENDHIDASITVSLHSNILYLWEIVNNNGAYTIEDESDDLIQIVQKELDELNQLDEEFGMISIY